MTTFVRGGPEAAFGVSEAAMETGPWMLDDAGRVCRGSLGVLIDDLLGFALIDRGPARHSGVTTELSVDFLATPPSDGSLLHGAAEVVHTDATSGLGRCLIVDSLGTTIAAGTQRVRYVPATPPALGDEVLGPPNPASVWDVIGASGQRGDGGAVVSLSPPAWVANPVGAVHGGVLLCAAELAAGLYFRPWSTMSTRMTYLRPVRGPAEVKAEVAHHGRSAGVAQVTILADGKVCTLALISCQQVES